MSIFTCLPLQPAFIEKIFKESFNVETATANQNFDLSTRVIKEN